MTYTLKQIPEDFIVVENPVSFSDSGKYLIIKVTKKGLNTEVVAKDIAEFLRIPRKNIGYAGTKDKNAVTIQFMSVKDGEKKHFVNFKRERVQIEVVGKHSIPLSLGDLEGNTFTITLRNLDSGLEEKKGEISIPNLFGAQRFSTNNAQIGKALICKDFAKAVMLIDDGRVQAMHREFPTQPLKAIQELPRHTLLLYVHAYQSLLWNKVVESGCSGKIPLLGFGTELDEYDSTIEEAYEKLMEKEGISQRDFIIKQLQNISPEGDERVSHITTTITYSEVKEDELNVGKKKQTVSFYLPKGSYATVVVDWLCNN